VCILIDHVRSSVHDVNMTASIIMLMRMAELVHIHTLGEILESVRTMNKLKGILAEIALMNVHE
jgi:hypothetical protein